MVIGTTEAARLLNICVQRVRQLLKEGRIKGAKKVGRFWQIPLFNKMPKVIKGSRGPKGTWRKRIATAPTRITVNQHVIRSNSVNGTNEPVVRVQSGSKVRYCHEIEILGNSKVIYSINKALSCGAKVWLEVAADVMVKPFIYSDMEEAT